VRPDTIGNDRGCAAAPRERSRPRRFGLAAIGAGISVAALIAGGSMASAHHFTAKTTPLPDHGTVGITALGDSAPVYADNTRDVTFMLWAPDTCGKKGASPVFTDTEEVSTSGLKNSTVTTSSSYTPTQTGTYEWTAKIVVDSSGSLESGPTPCTDEPVSITKAMPHMSTTPSSGGVVGASVSDTATVSAGFNPTGTVIFTLFQPSDPTCSNPGGAVYTSTAEALVTGMAHSGTYHTGAVGTYHWMAAYSGDANNAALTSPCTEESVTTAQASPSLVTDATSGGNTGTPISDSATVSGGFNPTGTVTFRLYGPSDTTCGAAAIFTSANRALNGGVAQSASFAATTTAGTYNWIATYSGDANNTSVSSKCGDEPVAITTPNGGVQGITTPTGSVQGISDVPTPSTGGDADIKLAVALLAAGAGLLTALAGMAVSRRLRRRGR
jgi:hypothetical protein